jgi:hypothetical protein
MLKKENIPKKQNLEDSHNLFLHNNSRFTVFFKQSNSHFAFQLYFQLDF